MEDRRHALETVIAYSQDTLCPASLLLDRLGR